MVCYEQTARSALGRTRGGGTGGEETTDEKTWSADAGDDVDSEKGTGSGAVTAAASMLHS